MEEEVKEETLCSGNVSDGKESLDNLSSDKDSAQDSSDNNTPDKPKEKKNKSFVFILILAFLSFSYFSFGDRIDLSFFSNFKNNLDFKENYRDFASKVMKKDLFYHNSDRAEINENNNSKENNSSKENNLNNSVSDVGDKLENSSSNLIKVEDRESKVIDNDDINSQDFEKRSIDNPKEAVIESKKFEKTANTEEDSKLQEVQALKDSEDSFPLKSVASGVSQDKEIVSSENNDIKANQDSELSLSDVSLSEGEEISLSKYKDISAELDDNIPENEKKLSSLDYKGVNYISESGGRGSAEILVSGYREIPSFSSERVNYENDIIEVKAFALNPSLERISNIQGKDNSINNKAEEAFYNNKLSKSRVSSLIAIFYLKSKFENKESFKKEFLILESYNKDDSVLKDSLAKIKPFIYTEFPYIDDLEKDFSEISEDILKKYKMSKKNLRWYEVIESKIPYLLKIRKIQPSEKSSDTDDVLLRVKQFLSDNKPDLALAELQTIDKQFSDIADIWIKKVSDYLLLKQEIDKVMEHVLLISSNFIEE